MAVQLPPGRSTCELVELAVEEEIEPDVLPFFALSTRKVQMLFVQSRNSYLLIEGSLAEHKNVFADIPQYRITGRSPAIPHTRGSCAHPLVQNDLPFQKTDIPYNFNSVGIQMNIGGAADLGVY